MKTWRTWTTKELDRLDEMRLHGKTVAEIARELNRTEASIRNRMVNYPKGKAKTAAYLAAFDAAHTIGEIAKRFGVTKHAVKQMKRRLRRAGWKVPPATPRSNRDV